MDSILKFLFALSLTQIQFYFCFDFKDEILCDQSRDLSVDSILVFNKTQMYLFCGEEYYILNPSDVSDKYQVLIRDNITSLDQSLIPPINYSFRSNKTIYLTKIEGPTIWYFNLDWSIRRNDKKPGFKDFDSIVSVFPNMTEGLDGNVFLNIYERNGLKLSILDKVVENFILIYQNTSNKMKQFYLVPESNFSNEFNKSFLFRTLNGINISTGFISYRSGQEWINLLADRYWCEMEISYTQPKPFCSVKDISHWIDCRNKSDSLIGILWIVFGVVILIGLALVLLMIAIILLNSKRKDEKTSIKKSIGSQSLSGSIHRIDTKTGLTTDKRKTSDFDLTDDSLKSK